MVYGLFGNEVNLLVNVDSGDILWEKKVELFGSDHALTKPDLSIASLSFNFTDVFYTDSLSKTPLYANSKEGSDLVSVHPHSHSKFVMFHSLPIFLRLMIFTNAILTLLFFVMIVYHLKSFVFKIYSDSYFELQTITNLKYISYYLILIWLVDFSSTFILSPLQSSMLTNKAGIVSLSLNFPTINLLFAGFIIGVLAHVFSHGVALKEDNKLTI
tara:strand:- start:697 stop:1338 length:642 start_codon:yes stop_codon:yes gene_type:complete